MSKFKKEIDAELGIVVNETSKAITGAGIYGWNLVTGGTPVKTGRLRASWLLNVDVPSEATVPAVKSKKRVYADPIQPKVSFDVERNQAIIISNNVEYAEYIEHGTDRIRAFAMVATAVPKINNFLNRRLKKIK